MEFVELAQGRQQATYEKTRKKGKKRRNKDVRES